MCEVELDVPLGNTPGEYKKIPSLPQTRTNFRSRCEQARVSSASHNLRITDSSE
jgi:hypothetical protein